MSWDSLLDYIKQERLEQERQRGEKPVCCPVCATTLEDTHRGLHCPWGDWVEGI